MLNLDTNILLAFLDGKLRRDEAALMQGDTDWGISAIVIWELAKLGQLGKVNLTLDSPQLSAVLSMLHVWPLTVEVAKATLNLDFSADPADEIIAATSISHAVPLVTRDSRILNSKRVPLAIR